MILGHGSNPQGDRRHLKDRVISSHMVLHGLLVVYPSSKHPCDAV